MRTTRILIIVAVLMIPRFVQAQTPNKAYKLGTADFSSFHPQDKDPIAAGNEERQRWQEDYYYRQLTTQRSNNVQLENRVRESTARAQSGIVITPDNSTVRTGNSTRTRQQQNARREQEHQVWAEQREEEMEAERERQRLERLREQARKQQQYNRAKAESLRRNAAHYAELQNTLAYRATVGRDLLYNSRPDWMEPLTTENMLSDNRNEIASIVSRSGSGRHTVRLTGHEHSSLDSDWDRAIARIYPLEKTEIPAPGNLFFSLTKEDTSDIVGYEIKPIANGCGAEGDPQSHDLARIGSMIEASHIKEINGIRFYSLLPLPYSEEDINALERCCTPHDLGYYYANGDIAQKFDIDRELTKGAPLKGIAVMMSTSSIKAFYAARKENEMSRYLQRRFNANVEHGMHLVPLKSKKP